MNIAPPLLGPGTVQDFDTVADFLYFLSMFNIEVVKANAASSLWENMVWDFCDRYFKDKVRDLEDI